jgi:UPF0716 protein FxsA
MPAILVILLVVVPVVELVIVLQVGSALGVGWTIALLVAASLLGAYLLRVEGARTWRQFRQALAEGRWPGDEVAQGALVLVGGALLLTPGFLTDVVGFLFLLAPTRRLVAGWLHRTLTPAGFQPFVGRWNAARGGTDGPEAPAGGGDPRRARPTRTSRPAPGRRSDGPPALEIEVVQVERERTEEGGETPPDGAATGGH